MKKIILILLCFWWVHKDSISQVSQMKYLIYEDTGFCFISGPHYTCKFIASNKNNLEETLRKSANKPIQYLNIFGTDFSEYFNIDMTLSKPMLGHTYNISYLFGKNSLDSVQYYKVIVKIKIPIDNFCYNIIKPNEYTNYGLRYSGKKYKIYSLILNDWGLFECIDFKVL